MIPRDLLPTYLLEIANEFFETGVYPHICLYKGILELREGVEAECKILHQCSNDELENGFLPSEEELLLKIIKFDCNRLPGKKYITYPIIKEHKIVQYG